MSYTPDDQYLEPGIDKTLEGMQEIFDATHERLKHPEEWNKNHLDELSELQIDLIRLRRKLSDLKKTTR